MLRHSKDPYTDRKVTKRFARLAQEPRIRVMLSDIGAIDPQDESFARPCGDEEKYPEKCTGPGDQAQQPVEENPLDRVDSIFRGQTETIGEWLTRHQIPSKSGKFRFYHGTPKAGGATDELREGSLLADSPEEAIHYTGRDRGLEPNQINVHELWLSPDELNGGHFASLRKAIKLGKGPGQEGGSEGSGALSGHDLLLIHDQARLQHADSPEQIQGLTDAWNAAKGAIYTKPEIFSDPETTEQLALQLGTLIEPRNKGRYRHVPATFGPGKPPAVDPSTVPRAMQQLWMAYSEQLLEPDEWYHEFEKVHPLEDGNGRLGDLMWKIAKVRKGEEWPNTHPPDLFGTDESQFSAEKNKG